MIGLIFKGRGEKPGCRKICSGGKGTPVVLVV
jgi:hypothetical protein